MSLVSSKIAIVGGGFGGVRAALDLSRKFGNSAELTLIDRNAFHLFVPDLYEVASAFGMTDDQFAVRLRKTVSIPYADIFNRTHVRFVQGEVMRIDLSQKMIVTKGEAVYPFDYLVLALGSQAADFDIPGVREYAFQFKTIEDGLMLNSELVMLFERAGRNEIELPLRITVGGGGFTGVELAGELATTVRHLSKMHRLRPHDTVITLVEAGSKIMPAISERERRAILARLTTLGVVVRTNCAIEHALGDLVKLRSGMTIKHHLLVWTAGVRPNDLLRRIDQLPLSPSGKIPVDEHLAVSPFHFLFAIGDIAEFIDHSTDRPEPALAYVAADQGRTVALNIRRSVDGKSLRPHKPFYSIWIAPVGGKWAVAHLWFGIWVKGFLGWVIRQLADLRYFMQILPRRKALRLMREEVEVYIKND